MSVSDEELKNLWSGNDPTFHSAHSGSRNFWLALKVEKGIDVPYRRVLKVLRSIEDYAITQRRVFKFPRQNYNSVRGFFALVQADSMHIFPHNGYTRILILVDVFSAKLFARALKSGTAAETTDALKSIFAEAGTKPSRIETDRGTEFAKETKAYLKKERIFWAPKISLHKANFAEYMVYRCRLSLSIKLRQKLTDDWPSPLPSVVQSLNSRYLKRLGGLRPRDISSSSDDVLVTRQVGESRYSFPTYEEQEANQKKALASHSTKYLHRGDYVYVDKKREPFQKSDEVQKSHEVCIVDSVYCYRSPCLYRVRTLLDKPVAGYYYRPQLTLTTKPNLTDLFKVESASRPKLIKGVKHYWVKWLGWPDTYSQWVPESQIVGL